MNEPKDVRKLYRKKSLSASTRRGIEARKITANVKESTAETLKAVRSGKYG